MKLAILGATGKTGGHALESALAAGHHVRVLVRTPAKLTTKHERLDVVQGDATKLAEVKKYRAEGETLHKAGKHQESLDTLMKAEKILGI